MWDYALDLKNFHSASHRAAIVPILVATCAVESPSLHLHPDPDQVYRPISICARDLRAAIEMVLPRERGNCLNAGSWGSAAYEPTPTIIEAARALYAQHSVEAILRHDAGATNLHLTSRRIEEIIDEARAHRRKVICFVTGVPGAGKTLVGLDVATQRREATQPTHAVGRIIESSAAQAGCNRHPRRRESRALVPR